MERNEEQHIRRSGTPAPRRDERRQRIKDTFRRKQYDVTVIEPTVDVIEPNVEPPKKRVCAYCRVSTDDDAQLSSYELQVQYYREYISAHPDWELVDIYADEGMSYGRNPINTSFESSQLGTVDSYSHG